MAILAARWLLFGSAFLSAKLLPGPSEAVLLVLLASGTGQPALLVTAALLGSIADAVMNRGIGRYILRFKDRSWVPTKDATNTRAQAWFARYGIWSLLLSWVPIIGDPLTLVTGIMRVSIGRFLIFVTLGKVLRHTLILLAWRYQPA